VLLNQRLAPPKAVLAAASPKLLRGKSQLDGGGIPEMIQPWAGILVAHALRGDVAGPLREMPDEQLRHLARSIALNHGILSQCLTQLDLPPIEGHGFWAGIVLPAIRSELERRSQPKRTWGADSPIARLKQMDIVEVSGKFTQLTGSGNRLRGLCPLHQERTASFYVYVDSQRWKCYGACAEGGDVVDLVQRLRSRGRDA
jgi:hypothetical protein